MRVNQVPGFSSVWKSCVRNMSSDLTSVSSSRRAGHALNSVIQIILNWQPTCPSRRFKFAQFNVHIFVFLLKIVKAMSRPWQGVHYRNLGNTHRNWENLIAGQNKESLNHVFSRCTRASRRTTWLLKAIKLDTHITAKYTRQKPLKTTRKMHWADFICTCGFHMCLNWRPGWQENLFLKDSNAQSFNVLKTGLAYAYLCAYLRPMDGPF